MRIAIIVSLATVGMIALLTACNSQENLVSKLPTNPNKTAPQGETSPAENARRITAQELHELWANGKVLVVDTRNEPSFKQGHIKGAILIPAGEFASRADELPRDKMIVTYCT
jgi:3-mercaptopyruvate sulfurtransferase SseA